MPGMKTVVVSRTLRQEDYPDLTIIGESLEESVGRLRAAAGDKTGRDAAVAKCQAMTQAAGVCQIPNS